MKNKKPNDFKYLMDFFPLDASMLQMLNEVSEWARKQNYEESAVNTFPQLADYYLIAHAKSSGHTIVTHEIPSSSTRKIKIPNVCIRLKIKYITPYQMLRKESAHFIQPPEHSPVQIYSTKLN